MGTYKYFSGKWALVTGASAGIGVALAKELAAHGANLILTARRSERLEAIAAELRNFGVEVRVVSADLNTENGPKNIFQATEELEIDILINNAGLGQFSRFHACDLEQELSQVRVNCESVVHLTRLYLPQMVARKRGWIMIVSSVAGFQPMPYLGTYAATKAFDRFFSEALAEEVKQDGINVSALCPGPTESEFFVVSRAGKLSDAKRQSATEVARLGIDGLINGKRIVIPYIGGKLITLLDRLLPVSWITKLIEKGSRPKN